MSKTEQFPASDIVVAGDLVGEDVERFCWTVEAAIAGGERRLVIDVSRAGCIEPEAWDFLTETAQRLSDAGGWLKLLNGLVAPRLIDPALIDACMNNSLTGGEQCIQEELAAV